MTDGGAIWRSENLLASGEPRIETILHGFIPTEINSLGLLHMIVKLGAHCYGCGSASSLHQRRVASCRSGLCISTCSIVVLLPQKFGSLR